MTTPDIAGLGEHLSNETEARLRAEVERNTAPFRTPDIAGLCERLRAVESSGHGGVTTNWHRNPDGPPAADTLERQDAEIERLRDKVEGLESDLQDAVQVAYLRGATVWAQLNYPDIIGLLSRSSEARAALTGEDTATLSLSGKTQTREDACTS